MSIQGLEKLEAWCKARDFALRVYREVLPLLPPEEKWASNQQIRRAVQSIPANIAEGYGRYYYQDNVRFCYIARGSLEETLTYIVLANELNYIPDPLYRQLAQNGEELVRVINGYIAYLKRSRKGDKEIGSSPSVKEQVEFYTTSIIENHEDE